MSVAFIVTGDDSVLPVELKKNDQTFVIDPTATVKAAVISKNKKTVLIPEVTVLEGTEGSSWATSTIVVTFTSLETGAITRLGDAILEVQVDDNGKTTWFAPIKIEKGTIA